MRLINQVDLARFVEHHHSRIEGMGSTLRIGLKSKSVIGAWNLAAVGRLEFPKRPETCENIRQERAGEA